MRLSEQLLERGVFAQGFARRPCLPGTSRLRITLMATHTREHIEKALEAFEDLEETGMTTRSRQTETARP